MTPEPVIDRHQAALDALNDGKPDDALILLREELAETLDADLLNDLAVVALQTRGLQVADSLLRAAEFIAPDEAITENLRALAERRPHRFAARLSAAVLEAALSPDQQDNNDWLRHSDGPPPTMPAHLACAALAGLVGEDWDLGWLYETLADDASRALMVALFAFRLLGARKVRLPLGVDRQENAVAYARDALQVAADTADLGFMGWKGDRYDLAPLGHPVRMDAHVLNIVTTFQLEQYRCPEHPEAAAVRPGDTVIDGGGCWGDTALYFASLVGPRGRVRTYEFVPANLRLLRANLALNPDLAARIDVDERALWGVSGELLNIAVNGPGTTVGAGGDGCIPSLAIDDLVASGELDRIDFIKLDIEGAELAALRGAEQVLRRDRPRLAIALYHRPEDWITIPRFLADLGLGYRFSLGHFTVHAEETVLFAWTDG